MRDAFGGVFMIRLLLVFIVIYVAFTAISLNYAKAFRIKNKVISFVEENEITDIEHFFSVGDGSNLEKLDNILSNANYNVQCPNGDGIHNESAVTNEGAKPIYCYHGVMIKEKDKDANASNNIIYYDVKTFVDWNLGALNMVLALGGRDQNSESAIRGKWQISGEAKVINRAM